MKILIVFLIVIPVFASSVCDEDWKDAPISNACNFKFNNGKTNQIIQSGLLKKNCFPHEGSKNKVRCVVIRTCGLGKKNIVSSIIHETPSQLNGFCSTSKPFRLTISKDQSYVEFTCEGSKAFMNFVAGDKRKTCPLPFKMP